MIEDVVKGNLGVLDRTDDVRNREMKGIDIELSLFLQRFSRTD